MKKMAMINDYSKLFNYEEYLDEANIRGRQTKNAIHEILRGIEITKSG